MLGGETSAMFKPKLQYHDGQALTASLTAFEHLEDIPMADARALLKAHVTWAYDEFRALGAPHFEINAHVDRFFAHLGQVMPPKGGYFLAHDRNGQAIGTGSLRRVSHEVAEMKHLYVRPEARCMGLGRDLIVARVAAARELGVKLLVADTFRGNEPMIRLYRRLGFNDSAPYESAVSNISPELVPFLHYFELEL